MRQAFDTFLIMSDETSECCWHPPGTEADDSSQGDRSGATLVAFKHFDHRPPPGILLQTQAAPLSLSEKTTK